MKKLAKAVVIFTIVTTFTTGCRSTEEYKKLAEAADDYTQAANQVLLDAGKIQIDTTSELILDTKIRSRDFFARNSQEYKKLSDSDKELLEVINESRNHNKLLQDYFSQLKELAQSNAPDRVETAIQNTVDRLGISGQIITRSTLINIDISAIAGSIGRIIISDQINSRLRKEIERNQKVILTELKLQQQLQQQIANLLQERIKQKQELQETRLVLRPLQQPVDLTPEQMLNLINNRKTILTSDQNTIDGLNKASSLLDQFTNAFQNATEEKITSAEVKTIVQNTDSFVTLVFQTSNPKKEN